MAEGKCLAWRQTSWRQDSNYHVLSRIYHTAQIRGWRWEGKCPQTHRNHQLKWNILWESCAQTPFLVHGPKALRVRLCHTRFGMQSQHVKWRPQQNLLLKSASSPRKYSAASSLNKSNTAIFLYCRNRWLTFSWAPGEAVGLSLQGVDEQNTPDLRCWTHTQLQGALTLRLEQLFGLLLRSQGEEPSTRLKWFSLSLPPFFQAKYMSLHKLRAHVT